MPHHADDQRHPHLPLLAEELNPERRRQPAPPSPPPSRGGRHAFAGELHTRLNVMQEAIEQRPAPPAGIQPHLVFRVPLSGNASPQAIVEMLERIGIGVVSIEHDNAIIAFRDDVNLSTFRDALMSYEQGPQDGINPQTGREYESTQWDVLEYIEATHMRLWGREDRIGHRLANVIGEDGSSIEQDSTFIVDIELWHRGTRALCEDSLREVRLLVETDADDGERVCDTFDGELLCLAIVSVRAAKLNALLDLDIVAELELPPRALFDPRTVGVANEREFGTPTRPPQDGPSVCIVDSGVTENHPLLANHVGHAEAFHTSTSMTSDEYGHGTQVGGVAVFGNIRACCEKGVFQSPVTLYSARVLNEDNRFDDETLIIHQMESAVAFFAAPPYNCRVFNVSLGDSCAWFETNARQSLWAEALDILARQHQVLFVVSAGNHDLGWASQTEDAEEVLQDFPNFLFRVQCGLCEPATAALPITVGAIAEYEEPSRRSEHQEDDLLRVIAAPGEPLPITRIGPGVNKSIKPEFVDYGGNVAFEGFSIVRRIRDNPGIAVMSLSNEPTQRLFSFDIGTSLAAPLVARKAALLWDSLRDYIDAEPQPNLVRAVLASAAQVPNALHDRIHPEHGEEGVRFVGGYGQVDDDLALDSADRRVTLVAQDRIRLDSFAIYEVPAPVEFRRAPGAKRVVVALAYDPPVRRRRAEYLGVRMDYALIRGKSVDEIVEAYRAVSPEERSAVRSGELAIPGALRSPFRCDLSPGPRTLQTSTLQRSEWSFQRENNDYGESWYLVVRSTRTWAPESITHQTFGVSLVLEADEPRLYTLVRQRVRLRQQQRARARS